MYSLGACFFPDHLLRAESRGRRLAALGNAIAFLASAKMNGFKTERIGPCEGLGSTMRCRSSYLIPGATRTNIEIDDEGRFAVDATLYYGPDHQKATIVFEKYAEMLEHAFPGRSSRSVYKGLPQLTVRPKPAKLMGVVEIEFFEYEDMNDEDKNDELSIVDNEVGPKGLIARNLYGAHSIHGLNILLERSIAIHVM